MRRIDVQASVLPRVWPHDRIARCALYGLDFLFGFLFDICGSMAVSCTRGCVAASDAFFPFADGLLQAAEAGATAVIQPGGSIRDDEVIEAANEAGLAMVFTGMRHFRH